MQWNDLTIDQYNAEVASRLRGLAAMVESCDTKVKIRMSARLVWEQSDDRFQTGIVSFPEFSDRFTTYTTQKLLEIVKSSDEPVARELEQKLTEMIQV